MHRKDTNANPAGTICTKILIVLSVAFLLMVVVRCEEQTATTTAPTEDTTPPFIVSTTPADSATNVPPDVTIYVEFSEVLLPYSVSASRVKLTAIYETFDLAVPGNVYCDSNIVRFDPQNELVDTVDYSVTIYKAIQDLAGNMMTSSYSWVFSTDDNINLTSPGIATVAQSDSVEITRLCPHGCENYLLSCTK